MPEVLVDPLKAVEVAKAAVTESLAAARDGRDTFSMRTLVATLLGKVANSMIGSDILNLKEPTRESLEKARKQWDEQLATLEKDAKDDGAKKVLASVRSNWSVPFTDAQIEAMLLPGQCKPVVAAFYRAFEKRDREALKALLTPKTAAAIADKDMTALVKDMFANTPRQIRLVSIAKIRLERGGSAEVPCNVKWVDEDGKEHRLSQDLHMVKTDKGWLVGD